MSPKATKRSTKRSTKKSTGAAVWRLIVDAGSEQFTRTVVESKQIGLGAGLSSHLLVLDEKHHRPMGWLATHFGLDPSTVTWVVDRLEERGLVERRPSEDDRRVKTVALTPLGVLTKARLEKVLYEPPPELFSLDVGVLEAVHDVLLAGQEAGPRRFARHG